ncbi:sigma-70 family RNA polymerase sigma factor [Caloramator sp. E03]|uniref:sigma-70 family RNA polymerase sigma factor n=1 Tax=Caloramator sp. E03 TaxID=2576307 RepID=UPI001110B383|nr:sigma-70 family RNA polymerase sigma factor [Caloramator sp. E03]QCX33497.1 sigma-70 family RNA polymerase sigma factor [Caloramator sp. E03]
MSQSCHKVKKGSGTLTNEQMFEMYMKGDKKAREQLILKNINLVRHIANKYYVLFEVDNYKDFDLEDLIQIGTIGLIKAIEKYDPSMGNKFSTYAVIWIKQTIRRALEGHEETLSLDEKINNEGEEDNLTFIDMLKDKSFIIDEELEKKEFKSEVWAALKEKLTEQELEFIKLKFVYGLTENSIAERMGMTNKEFRNFKSRLKNNLRTKVRKLKVIYRHWIDENTFYVKAVDYSKPKVQTSFTTSTVELTVMKRELLREKLREIIKNTPPEKLGEIMRNTPMI